GLAIHLDPGSGRVDPLAQAGRPAVHPDPALPDQLLAGPAGAETGARQDLLEPLAAGRGGTGRRALLGRAAPMALGRHGSMGRRGSILARLVPRRAPTRQGDGHHPGRLLGPPLTPSIPSGAGRVKTAEAP